MRRPALAVALAATLAAACSDEQGFNAPGLGDFVQDVEPDPGEVLDRNKLGTVGIVVVLNFLPAESFGFGGLLRFRLDGQDVTLGAEVATTGGTPAESANIAFRPDDIADGAHDVEVEYTDSRNVLYRVRWEFTIRD